MTFLTKTALILTTTATLSGCMQSQPPIPRDDPRWAQADARYEGTVYSLSGIAGLAYIGASRQEERVSILYDPAYATDAEVAAAPAKLCADRNTTVASSTVAAPQSEIWGETTLELVVICAA